MSNRVVVAARSLVAASIVAATTLMAVAPAATATADATPPTVSAPVVRLSSGFGIVFGSVATTTITVTGHDAGSFSTTYPPAQIAVSRNGGAWTTLSLLSERDYPSDVWRTISVVVPRTLALDGTYRFRARMRDRVGNWSGWKLGPMLSPRRIFETSHNIVYSAGWTHVTDPSPGFSYETASVAGATATFTFTARSIAWLSRAGIDHGTAEVRIDGVLVATVNLYRNLVEARRPVFSKTWSTLTKHVMTITVLGTADHPEVDVTGFLVLA